VKTLTFFVRQLSLTLFVILLFSVAISAQSFTQLQKLTASDAAAGDLFGHTVSLDGDTAIVGAYTEDNSGGSNAGSAYVFVRSGGTWTQQQKLTASDAAPGYNFGFSVSVSGDTVVVGSISVNNSSGQHAGAAYVFTRTAGVWTQQQRIQPVDAQLNDGFGYSVSVSGDTVVISSAADDDGADAAGSAYVFTRSGGVWTQQQKLVASDPSTANFGHSMSMNGDTIVIGAWAKNNGTGAAYVFVKMGATWIQQQKLTAADPVSGNSFGWSVSVSDDTTAIGAIASDDAGNDSGSTYIFTRSAGVWTQRQKIQASDAGADDLFGLSVSMNGDMLVVSAAFDNNGSGVDAGSIYIFTKTGGVWTQQQKLTASDAAAGDEFGFSLSLSGDTVMAGADKDDNSGGIDAGSAYVFVPASTNASPVVNAGPDQSATENVVFNLTGSFSDADPSDTHTATLNWGDGSPTEGATVGEPSGSNAGTVTGSHTYVAPGNYTVTLAVLDSGNASGGDTLQVVVGTGVSGNYIQNTTTQQANANFNISGSGVVGGNLSVIGALNASGSGLTNLNASNISNGTLADAHLSTNVATLSGVQTFADLKSFAGGISGNGSGLTNLNANNIGSGTLDNARLGVVGVANGGTGLTSAGTNGNFLRSNGAGFTSSPLTATDIPAGNTNYIQNTTTQQTGANFNVAGSGVVGGDLSVTGVLNASGSGLTNLNAASITSGTLDTARLGSIPTSNIADSAVTTPKIGDSAVTTSKIADSAVTASKIGSNEVVKNLNGMKDNVTLTAGANVTITPVGNTLTIATSGGNFIQNSTSQQPGSNFNISGDGIVGGNLSVNGSLNASGSALTSLNAANITAGTLNNARLGSISTPNIADGAITTPKIVDGAVTAAKVGNNQVVKNLNGLTDGVNLSAGSNVTITPSGNTLTIASSGGASQWTTSGSNISYNSGNIGIGTTNPDSLIHLAGPSGVAAITFNTPGPGNQRFRFQTVPGIPNWGGLSINGNYAYPTGWMLDDTASNGWFFKLDTRGANTANASNGLWLFRIPPGANPHTDESPVFGVTNGQAYFAGNLGIGTTSPTSKLHVIGDAKLTGLLSVDGTFQLNSLGSGGSTNLCRNATSQIAACSSSLRYKTNIAPFAFGLDLVRRLRPIRFEWKEGGLKDLGFGAEDVAAVEPLLVTYNARGEVEGVKYDRISAVLVNAVKEQQAQIEAQQIRLRQQQVDIEKQQQQLKQQGILILGLKTLVCQQNPNAEFCK
jgi:FG-GAP repeat/PKD domain/Chaperone of endosialidase